MPPELVFIGVSRSVVLVPRVSLPKRCRDCYSCCGRATYWRSI